MILKALSIRQPWAWLIVEGWKDVENRTWSTNFRGRFYIHASKTFDDAAYVDLRERRFDLPWPSKSEFCRGGIIGAVTLSGCYRWHESVWFEGPFGFHLTDPARLAFIPCRGRLKFFTVGLAN